MKIYKEKGKIRAYQTLHNSYYGNPHYIIYIEFDGERLESAKTQSNSKCAFLVESALNTEKEIEYHYTNNGSMIVTNIK